MADVEERSQDGSLLQPLAAAHRLGITAELLFQFTKKGFAKASGLRSLRTVEQAGATLFSIPELDDFDALLAGPWPSPESGRPSIPKAIADHLRAESHNQCARCGSGIGIDTAHIRPWAESRSHHPSNLIRLCSACHREHDAQHSLTTAGLLDLKAALVERTRANLTARMGMAGFLGRMPRPAETFVGRENELSGLTDALRSGRSVIVTGVGGVGKTELLVQALRRAQTGRPVLWIDVEQHRTAGHVLLELRTALGGGGMACPEEMLPGRLDAYQACVVFDGIERASLDDIDALEDAITAIHRTTAATQVVATSQIMLHGFGAHTRVKVGPLDELSSRKVLERAGGQDGVAATSGLGPLLRFCEGHALTLRLATAMMDHYGGPSAALRAIKTRGVGAVRLPGRRRQSPATSLEMCLRTAYEALSTDARRLVWVLAEAPAGLWGHYIDGDWLELPDPTEALAELRSWNLIDLVPFTDDLARTQMLGPVRAFVAERGRQDQAADHEAAVGRLVEGFGMMVAVLELKYDDPNDTPHVLSRYGDELPNFLHALDLARRHPGNSRMLLTAVSIVSSLMRYFFVRGLAQEGAAAMHAAAELAISAGRLGQASGLILQAFALADRANSEVLSRLSMALADRLEQLTDDGEILADLALCRGLKARGAGDHHAAERYARQAFSGYREKLRAAVEQRSAGQADVEESSSRIQELHNDLSHALGLLGFSLLSLGRYEEAAKAYQHSLRHERGAAVAVNRGQTLHQIGNCYMHLGRIREAAKHYHDAARIFHFVGMEEYLGNALGELGYAVLELSDEAFKIDLEVEIIDEGLRDLGRQLRRVFDPTQALDHKRCAGMTRKLFGSIIFLSLIGQGRRLDNFCVDLHSEIAERFGDEITQGQRNQDDVFSVMMVDMALWFGAQVAAAESILAAEGAIPEDLVWEMLRMVCNANDWARHVMRVVDWFAALLTYRWRYQGASRERLHEFVTNFDDGIIDDLELLAHKENMD